jgi:hypothetical protein
VGTVDDVVDERMRRIWATAKAVKVLIPGNGSVVSVDFDGPCTHGWVDK